MTSVQKLLCKNELWDLLSLFDTTTARKLEQLQKITLRVTSQFPLRAMMMRVQCGPLKGAML